MKFLKVSVLLGLLGLSLMGSDCGGPVVKCAEQKDQTACEKLMKDNGTDKLCKWTAGTPEKVVTPAKCENTVACPTPKYLQGDSAQQQIDKADCETVSGCVYTGPDSTKTPVVNAKCERACPAPTATSTKVDCENTVGCTYTAEVKQAATPGVCSDN